MRLLGNPSRTGAESWILRGADPMSCPHYLVGQIWCVSIGDGCSPRRAWLYPVGEMPGDVAPIVECAEMDEPPRIPRSFYSIGWETVKLWVDRSHTHQGSGTGCPVGFGPSGEHHSEWAAICSIASKFGCVSETLRKWVRQAEANQGLAGC